MPAQASHPAAGWTPERVRGDGVGGEGKQMAICYSLALVAGGTR
jgi:hypothetical protein